jgi:hypothetical protein
MPHLHLAKDFFGGNIAAGKKMCEQSGYVGTTEQRMSFLLFSSGFQQKEHGHHHHGHVMMPSQPTTNLVMIHPGGCFGILEGTFNKISLPLCWLSKTMHKKGRFFSESVNFPWVNPRLCRGTTTV